MIKFCNAYNTKYSFMYLFLKIIALYIVGGMV